MPWQYNGYIKFGQVTVPVIIKFVVTQDAREKGNSWITDADFGEMRHLLKPAAELAFKCHYDTTGATDKYLDAPTFSQGPRLSMGYTIHQNKEASEVISKVEIWFEHEDDDEVLNGGEYSGLRDLGGKMKELRQTKTAIRASVIRRGDYTAEEEKRQVYKNLGVKMDSFNQYFKPHNENQEIPKPSTSKKNYDDDHVDQPAVEPVAVSGSNNNVPIGSDDGACSNLEGPNDIIIPDNISSHTGPTRSPATNNSVYSGSQMNDGEDLWNMQGDYYEEKDQDGGYAPGGYESPPRSHHSDESRGIDSPERAVDEEDEELPDIDEVPLPALSNLAIGSLIKDISRSGSSKKPSKKINVSVKPKPKNIPSKRARDEMRPDDSASKENTANGLLGSPKKKKNKSPTLGVSDSSKNGKNKKKKKKSKTLGKNLSDIFAAVDGTSTTKKSHKSNSSSSRKSKRDRKDSDSGRTVPLPNTLSTSTISKELPLNRSPQKEPPTEESLQRSLTELTRVGSVSSLSELVATVSERTNVPRVSPVPTLAATINTLNSSISNNNTSSPTKGLTSSSAVTIEASSRTPTTRSRGGNTKPKGKGKTSAADREANNKRSDKSPIASSKSSIRTLAQRKDYSEKPATLTSSKTLRSRNSSQASDIEADGVTIIHEKERRRRRRDTSNPIIKQESLDSIMSRVITAPTSNTKVVFDPEMPVIDLMVRPGEQNGVPTPVSATCTSPLLAPAIDLHGVPENNKSCSPLRRPLTPLRPIKHVSDSQSSSTSLISVTASISFTSAADSAFAPVKSRSSPASPVPANALTTRASISPVRNTPKLVASPVTLPLESVPKSPSTFNPITKSLASIVNSSPVTVSSETSPVTFSKQSRSTTPIASCSFPVTTRRTSVSPFQSTLGSGTVRAVTPVESNPIVPERSRSITPTPQLPRASRLADIVKSIQRQSIDDSDDSIGSDNQLSELELSTTKSKGDEVLESLSISPARKRLLDINDNVSHAKRVIDSVDNPTSLRRQAEENVTLVTRPIDSPSTSRQVEDNMPTKRQAETSNVALVPSKRSSDSDDVRDGARPAKSKREDQDTGTSTQIRLSPRVDDENVMDKRRKRKARGKSKTLSPQATQARSILPTSSSMTTSLSQKSSPSATISSLVVVTPPTTTSKESALRQIPSLKSILEQQDQNDLMHGLLEDQEDFEVEENLVNEAREKSAAFATILDNYASDGESSNGEEEEQQVVVESSPTKQTFPGVYIKQMMEVSSQDLRNVLQPVNVEEVGPVTICESELPFDADLDLYESIKVPIETNMEDSYNLFSYDDDMDKALDTAIANNDDVWLESSPQKRLLDYENSNNVVDSDEFPRLGLVGSPRSDSSDSRPGSPIEPSVTSAESISSPGPSSKSAAVPDKQPAANFERRQLSPVSKAGSVLVNSTSPTKESRTLDTAYQPEPSVNVSIPEDPNRPLFNSIGLTKLVVQSVVPDENFHFPVRIKRESGYSHSSPHHVRKSRRQSSSSHQHHPAIKGESMDRPMSSRSRRSRPLSPPKSDKGSSMPPPKFPAPRTPKKMRDSRNYNLNGTSNAIALRRPLFGGDRSSGTGRSFEDMDSSAVGNRLSPRAMSTREIVSNTDCLEACVNLLGQVASEPGIAGKVAGELGVGPRLTEDGSSSSAEADVKVVCKVKNTVNNRRGKKKIKEEKDSEKTGTELVLWRKRRAGQDDEEEEEEEDNRFALAKHRRGTALIKEMIVRTDRLKHQQEEYEPQGDEFDLSQSSFCMLNVFENYAQHSRCNKMLRRKIALLSLEDLTDYYENYIIRTLRGIVEGKTSSYRMELYLQLRSKNSMLSVNASKELKDNSVREPFTEEQFNHVSSLVNYDFHPNRKEIDDGEMNYAASSVDLTKTFTLPHYVLLPETLIRIYGYETGQSLERAEMQMKHGAVAWDGENLAIEPAPLSIEN